MSLYHETAAILSGSGSPQAHAGGSFKSRVFGAKDLKSPPAQVYALALESCKWSAVLREVVENAQLLQIERKLTPPLAILLVHDLLVSKSGIALPATHGLRASVERHKARLTSEFTRARLRRRCATLPELRAQVEAAHRAASGITLHPRWIRVNTLKSTVDEQLATTFAGWEVLPSVAELLIASASSASASGDDISNTNSNKKKMCLDGNVPNLIAASPVSGVDFTKTEAYRDGKIILQDKASCFPAYLLDHRPEDGDVVDACAAPGNKTTHLAAILAERDGTLLPRKGDGKGKKGERKNRIFAFEKDVRRAKTLEKMVGVAGSDGFTKVNAGCDFLKVDPQADEYRHVGALLLDPSCSGSGIVGRDVMPEMHLPATSTTSTPSAGSGGGGGGKNGKNGKKGAAGGDIKKRKRDPSDSSDDKSPNNNKKPALQQEQQQKQQQQPPMELVDDDGTTTTLTSAQDLQSRISALAAFQLTLLLHAMAFPAARRISYSTCSVYAGENEHVVMRALRSGVARRRGWRVLRREEQVSGLREWDVRGSVEACEGFSEGCQEGEEEEEEEEEEEARVIAEACVRAYNRDDGRGVMGFFVAGFVRDGDGDGDGGGEKDRERVVEDDGGPFVRDEEGRIVRDENGIPTLKSTGRKAVDLDEMMDEDEESEEYYIGVRDGGGGEGEGGDEGPFLRDENGRIVRDAQGMPSLKPGSVLKKKVKNKKKAAAWRDEGFEDNGAEDEWDGFGD